MLDQGYCTSQVPLNSSMTSAYIGVVFAVVTVDAGFDSQ